MERIERTSEAADQAALQLWSEPETHAQIREYLRKTLGK
jgi:hypothetical protein